MLVVQKRYMEAKGRKGHDDIWISVRWAKV